MMSPSYGYFGVDLFHQPSPTVATEVVVAVSVAVATAVEDPPSSP